MREPWIGAKEALTIGWPEYLRRIWSSPANTDALSDGKPGGKVAAGGAAFTEEGVGLGDGLAGTPVADATAPPVAVVRASAGDGCRELAQPTTSTTNPTTAGTRRLALMPSRRLAPRKSWMTSQRRRLRTRTSAAGSAECDSATVLSVHPPRSVSPACSRRCRSPSCGPHLGGSVTTSGCLIGWLRDA